MFLEALAIKVQEGSCSCTWAERGHNLNILHRHMVVKQSQAG